MTVYNTIAGLINKGIEKQLIDRQDMVYTYNRIISLLQIDTSPEVKVEPTKGTIPDLLENLLVYAVREKVIIDTHDNKDKLQANIMNCFLPHPSIINQRFWQLYNHSPVEATNYFYQLSINSNYIQIKQINKNIHFTFISTYGELEITINLSRPEKDAAQIEREALQQDLNYPKCVLCIENEGYDGRINYPARANHRMIKVPIDKEDWFLQYSPYAYYNEHSILLSEVHRPMQINKTTFQHLLSFVEQFPHYFIGSNADLPIVGGSILSHDHYQAGRKEFPMTIAANDFTFTLNSFPSITASVLKWPMSVIRLKSAHKGEIIEAANYIFTSWQQYEDREVGIVPFTDRTPHNTITPIARCKNNQFELDIVLRNNRTNQAFPLGIFHPHQDVQHIKKESIGLIEVMGLAVLPGRLLDEINVLERALMNDDVPVASIHQNWLKKLRHKYDDVQTLEFSKQIMREELAIKFMKVLEDASVYKQTTKGKQALKRFIRKLHVTY